MAKLSIRSHTKDQENNSSMHTSKAWYEFDINADIWQLDASVKINFKLLKDLSLESNFARSFRMVLADYVSEFSASHIVNIYSNTRKLLLHISAISEIDEACILNYKATLTEQTESKLGCIRAFLLDWSFKGYKGISKNAITLLKELSLKGNEKGKAVALGCPYSGPYTMNEQAEFLDWYIQAFTNNKITLEQYSLIVAHQFTGSRSVQIKQLYFKDIILRNENGVDVFDINMPNAKKRNEGFRGSFRLKESVDEDLAVILTQQGKDSIKHVEECFNVSLNNAQKDNVPIFLNSAYLDKLENFQDFLEKQAKTPDILCLTKSDIISLILKIARLCPLKTKRIKLNNGEYGDLHVNPRRFRYTHATNMANFGASKFEIAEDLGHSSTQDVVVYTDITDKVFETLEDALESDLTPLAQAFSGTLIDSEIDSIRVNDPRSRIGGSDGNPVGNCGEHGFCANGTIHCYTCIKFQPWINAPHETMLQQVKYERDKKISMGASKFTLQGYNRSIDAITMVISMCKKRKIELDNEETVYV